MKKENVIKSKRFVVRKSLIGKNQVIEFTNKKGEVTKYNHDVVFSIMKENLEKLACWAKYKSYTATGNIPTILRGKELVQQLVMSRGGCNTVTSSLYKIQYNMAKKIENRVAEIVMIIVVILTIIIVN